MSIKRNEKVFKDMVKKYPFYSHKWRDRGFISCPNCGRPITTCPFCRQEMLLNKAETKPDYLLALSYVYVEAKGALDSWPFEQSIRSNQRLVANEHETWLFLEIGTGRAPKGKHAFFVPWESWLEVEADLLFNGKKSLLFEATERSRNPTARDVLGKWELEWITGGWAIPSEHEFWKKHQRVFWEIINERYK